MTILGITRHIDNLGRITLPSEIRKMYQLSRDDTVEIVGTPDGILLRVPDIVVIRNRRSPEESMHLVVERDVEAPSPTVTP